MDIPAFDELFKEIKTGFWLAGIPFDASRIRPRFYFMLLCMCLVDVAEATFLVSNYSPENFLALTQSAPCFCHGFLAALKILPIAAKHKKICELTKCLNELYNTILTDPKKKAVVKKEMILVKILIRYFFILNAALIAVYNFCTLVFMSYNYIVRSEVEFLLPFPAIFPYSVDTWPVWFVAYIHSICGGFTCVLYLTTVDALYSVLTSQICKNLAIISNEVQAITSSNVEDLKNIITKHQYILRLADDLEEIFRLPNLFNVLVGSLEVCALGFNLTIGPIADIPKCVLFITSVLLQILMMSVFGENLIQESKKIGDAAYFCEWYDMDLKSKKIILAIMTRCRKQQQLTAYKFSVISYGTFTKIISTSWSYFTILRTVYKPPE